MKKINPLALTGVIFFNLVVFLGLAATAVALLFSLWVIIASFITSPVILFVAYHTGLTSFSLWQILASGLLFVLGYKLIIPARQVTDFCHKFWITYLSFNKSLIYAKKISF